MCETMRCSHTSLSSTTKSEDAFCYQMKGGSYESCVSNRESRLRNAPHRNIHRSHLKSSSFAQQLYVFRYFLFISTILSFLFTTILFCNFFQPCSFHNFSTIFHLSYPFSQQNSSPSGRDLVQKSSKSVSVFVEIECSNPSSLKVFPFFLSREGCCNFYSIRGSLRMSKTASTWAFPFRGLYEKHSSENIVGVSKFVAFAEAAAVVTCSDTKTIEAPWLLNESDFTASSACDLSSSLLSVNATDGSAALVFDLRPIVDSSLAPRTVSFERSRLQNVQIIFNTSFSAGGNGALGIPALRFLLESASWSMRRDLWQYAILVEGIELPKGSNITIHNCNFTFWPLAAMEREERFALLMLRVPEIKGPETSVTLVNCNTTVSISVRIARQQYSDIAFTLYSYQDVLDANADVGSSTTPRNFVRVADSVAFRVLNMRTDVLMPKETGSSYAALRRGAINFFSVPCQIEFNGSLIVAFYLASFNDMRKEVSENTFAFVWFRSNIGLGPQGSVEVRDCIAKTIEATFASAVRLVNFTTNVGYASASAARVTIENVTFVSHTSGLGESGGAFVVLSFHVARFVVLDGGAIFSITGCVLNVTMESGQTDIKAKAVGLVVFEDAQGVEVRGASTKIVIEGNTVLIGGFGGPGGVGLGCLLGHSAQLTLANGASMSLTHNMLRHSNTRAAAIVISFFFIQSKSSSLEITTGAHIHIVENRANGTVFGLAAAGYFFGVDEGARLKIVDKGSVVRLASNLMDLNTDTMIPARKCVGSIVGFAVNNTPTTIADGTAIDFEDNFVNLTSTCDAIFVSAFTIQLISLGVNFKNNVALAIRRNSFDFVGEPSAFSPVTFFLARNVLVVTFSEGSQLAVVGNSLSIRPRSAFLTFPSNVMKLVTSNVVILADANPTFLKLSALSNASMRIEDNTVHVLQTQTMPPITLTTYGGLFLSTGIQLTVDATTIVSTEEGSAVAGGRRARRGPFLTIVGNTLTGAALSGDLVGGVGVINGATSGTSLIASLCGNYWNSTRHSAVSSAVAPYIAKEVRGFCRDPTATQTAIVYGLTPTLTSLKRVTVTTSRSRSKHDDKDSQTIAKTLYVSESLTKPAEEEKTLSTEKQQTHSRIQGTSSLLGISRSHAVPTPLYSISNSFEDSLLRTKSPKNLLGTQSAHVTVTKEEEQSFFSPTLSLKPPQEQTLGNNSRSASFVWPAVSRTEERDNVHVASPSYSHSFPPIKTNTRPLRRTVTRTLLRGCPTSCENITSVSGLRGSDDTSTSTTIEKGPSLFSTVPACFGGVEDVKGEQEGSATMVTTTIRTTYQTQRRSGGGVPQSFWHGGALLPSLVGLYGAVRESPLIDSALSMRAAMRDLGFTRIVTSARNMSIDSEEKKGEDDSLVVYGVVYFQWARDGGGVVRVDSIVESIEGEENEPTKTNGGEFLNGTSSSVFFASTSAGSAAHGTERQRVAGNSTVSLLGFRNLVWASSPSSGQRGVAIALRVTYNYPEAKYKSNVRIGARLYYGCDEESTAARKGAEQSYELSTPSSSSSSPSSNTLLPGSSSYVSVYATLLPFPPPAAVLAPEVVGMVAAVGVVSGILGGGAAADLQTIALLGLSSCSKGSARADREEDGLALSFRTLAPLATSGTCRGAVEGNLILVCGVLALHTLVAIAAKYALERRQVKAGSPSPPSLSSRGEGNAVVVPIHIHDDTSTGGNGSKSSSEKTHSTHPTVGLNLDLFGEGEAEGTAGADAAIAGIRNIKQQHATTGGSLSDRSDGRSAVSGEGSSLPSSSTSTSFSSAAQQFFFKWAPILDKVKFPSLTLIAAVFAQNGFLLCGVELIRGYQEAIPSEDGSGVAVETTIAAPDKGLGGVAVMFALIPLLSFSFIIYGLSSRAFYPLFYRCNSFHEPVSTLGHEINTIPQRRASVALASWVAKIFLPNGQLDRTVPGTEMFSTVVGRLRFPEGYMCLFSFTGFLASSPITFGSGGSSSLCSLLYAVSAALHALCAVLFAFVRPYRIHFSNAISALSAALTCAVVVLYMLLLSDPYGDDGGGSGAPTRKTLASALSALAVMQTVLSAIRITHSLFLRGVSLIGPRVGEGALRSLAVPYASSCSWEVSRWPYQKGERGIIRFGEGSKVLGGARGVSDAELAEALVAMRVTATAMRGRGGEGVPTTSGMADERSGGWNLASVYIDPLYYSGSKTAAAAAAGPSTLGKAAEDTSCLTGEEESSKGMKAPRLAKKSTAVCRPKRGTLKERRENSKHNDRGGRGDDGDEEMDTCAPLLHTLDAVAAVTNEKATPISLNLRRFSSFGRGGVGEGVEGVSSHHRNFEGEMFRPILTSTSEPQGPSMLPRPPHEDNDNGVIEDNKKRKEVEEDPCQLDDPVTVTVAVDDLELTPKGSRGSGMRITQTPNSKPTERDSKDLRMRLTQSHHHSHVYKGGGSPRGLLLLEELDESEEDAI